MKVVVNKGFHQFGLSLEALKKIFGDVYVYQPDMLLGLYFRQDSLADRRSRSNNFIYSTHDYGKETLKIDEQHRIYFDTMDRSLNKLVSVVEEMGQKAGAYGTSLKVIEIPDDVNWEIEEFDGQERIREVGRIWE